MFYRNLHLSLKCSVLLQKDLFKGGSSLYWRESFSKVIVTFVTQGLPSSSSAVLSLKFINNQKWCVPFSWRQNACQLLIRLDATSEHALRCSIWNQRQIIILNVITSVFNLHHMIRIMCIVRAAFSVFESPKIQSVCNHPPHSPRQCCTNYCFQMLLSFQCCAKCNQKNSPETILNWYLKMPMHLVPVQTTKCSHVPSFVKTEEFRSEWASPHLLNYVIGIRIMNTFKSL